MAELVIALLFGLGGLLLGSLWVAGAVYIYFDAERRNVKGARFWALGALLAGPLALVAYLIDRPKAAIAECSFCRRPILVSDRNCPYCGREQPGLPDPRGRASGEDPAKT